MTTRMALALFAILPLSSCGSSGRGGYGGGADLAAPLQNGDLGPVDLAGPASQDMANGGCATATYQGKQAPAALMVLMARNQTMGDGNKFNAAAQAVVQTLDADLFDTMSLGLYGAPSGLVAAPACLQQFGVASITCGTPAFPQIDLTVGGNLKSGDAMGVRRQIKDWLANNGPDPNEGDATPIYVAIQNAITALQTWKVDGKRILFVVTDGTFDCAQLSKRPGYPDGNGCDHDWENPSNVLKLLTAANQDPQRPVETFLVGVPGADTFDPQGVTAPPYHMRAALSAMAFAGSPKFVPANCTGKTWVQNTPDPQVSCHFDMTQNFNAGQVSTAISNIRGKVLGCLFDLPQPDGGMIDMGEVNVSYTVDGMTTELKKRNNPANQCLGIPCWDYSNGKVQLVGKACQDIQGATKAKVDIVVGCPTVIG